MRLNELDAEANELYRRINFSRSRQPKPKSCDEWWIQTKLLWTLLTPQTKFLSIHEIILLREWNSIWINFHLIGGNESKRNIPRARTCTDSKTFLLSHFIISNWNLLVRRDLFCVHEIQRYHIKCKRITTIVCNCLLANWCLFYCHKYFELFHFNLTQLKCA